jgi:hypothetical protein
MNLSHKASAFGISFPLTVESVWVGRSCLSYWDSAILPPGAHLFKGTLLVDGKINVLGQAYKSPSYAMAAVRNVIEGRNQNAPPRPTGGWPYWHFRDGNGRLRPIANLR